MNETQRKIRCHHAYSCAPACLGIRRACRHGGSDSPGGQQSWCQLRSRRFVVGTGRSAVGFRSGIALRHLYDTRPGSGAVSQPILQRSGAKFAGRDVLIGSCIQNDHKGATRAYAAVCRRADDEVDTVSVIMRLRMSYLALGFRKERNYSYGPGIERSRITVSRTP